MLGSRTQNAVRVRYSRRAGPGARLDSRIAVLGRHDFAVQTVGFVGGSGFSGNVFGAFGCRVRKQASVTAARTVHREIANAAAVSEMAGPELMTASPDEPERD